MRASSRPVAPSSGGLLEGVPYRRAILRVSLTLMVAIAAIRLPYELWRLLLDTGPLGAIDLRVISGFVKWWFTGAGRPSVYPPASHVLLWPFLGWVPLPLLRWVWAATMIAALGWLTARLERAAGPGAGSERSWFRLFVISNYATVIVIGNGQLALHILSALLAGILLLHGGARGWRTELAALLLLLLAMAKPSLAVPFFWVVLFACDARRVVFGAVAVYTALTVAAFALHPEGAEGLGSWLAEAHQIELGYASVHAWSRAVGLERYGLALSFGLLALTGLWFRRARQAELWVQLGIAAIIARIWTYHQLYDDLLLLFPAVALLRIARLESARERGLHIGAGLLVLALWAGLMGPGTLLRADGPLAIAYRTVQTLIWLATLGFLVFWAERGPVDGAGLSRSVPGATFRAQPREQIRRRDGTL